MKKLKIIPDVIGMQKVCTILPKTTIEQTVRKMVEEDASAVAVVDDAGAFFGIVTERDIIRRVLAMGGHLGETSIEQVMTRAPDTLDPGDSAWDALELMRCRNLTNAPVVQDGRVVGMVSVVDLCHVVSRELDAGLRRTQTLVFGDISNE